MYCTSCGVQLRDGDRYCSQCGTETLEGRASRQRESAHSPRKLRRSRLDKKLGGVCAGLAEFLGVDVTLVRILVFTAMIVSGGLVLLAYIGAWIIMPLEREGEYQTVSSASART